MLNLNVYFKLVYQINALRIQPPGGQFRRHRRPTQFSTDFTRRVFQVSHVSDVLASYLLHSQGQAF